MPMIALPAHFEGERIRLDEPFNLTEYETDCHHSTRIRA